MFSFWSTNTVIVNLVSSIVFAFYLIIIAKTFTADLKEEKYKSTVISKQRKNIYNPLSYKQIYLDLVCQIFQ